MIFLNGLLLGLSTGIFCLTWCAPIFTTLVLTKKRKLKQSFSLFFQFLFGRLIGCILFGALIGCLGLKTEKGIIEKINFIVLIVLSVLLIFYAFGLIKRGKIFCRLSTKKIKIPLLAGLLTGINVCPPFLLASSYVFSIGGVSQGILFFFSFSLATSLYLIPFIFLGFLGSQKIMQKIAQIIALGAGILFLIYGLNGLFSQNPCLNCPFFRSEINNSYLPLLIFVFLLVLSSIFYFKKIKETVWLRNIILLFSLIYFGFVLKNIFCPLRTFQNLFIQGSGIVLGLVSFLFFLLPIILALLIGKIYCFWLCPLGAFQEFIWQGKKSLKCSFLNKKILPSGVWQKYFKYFFLILIIVLLLIFREPILCGIDPFGALFGRFVTSVSIILLALLIIFSIFVYRPWCRFFCPYGAILSLFSKISFFKRNKK